MKKKKEKLKYSILNNAVYLLKDIYRHSKILFLLFFIEMICAVISPVFGLYLPKVAVDLIESQANAQKIILTLGMFVGQYMH